MSIGGRLNKGLELDCEEVGLDVAALSWARELREAPIDNPHDCGGPFIGVFLCKLCPIDFAECRY